MDLRQQRLTRMKWIATILMILMAALFLFSYLQGNKGYWHWVAAFSEAALIGALADWFAVVAFFKHPLNIPIPRTAIIPKNKERIAKNLAIFIQDNFLSSDILIQKMRSYNPALKIGRWLSTREKADQLARQSIFIFTHVLSFMNDKRVGKLFRHALYRQINQIHLGHFLAQLLHVLTQNNQHQALLNEGLKRFSTLLDTQETKEYLALMIIDVSKNEYPQLLKMLGIVLDTEKFSFHIANALVNSLQNWMHAIGQDLNHPKRQQLDALIENWITHIKEDPKYHERIEQYKEQFLSDSVVLNYVETLWETFRQWLIRSTFDVQLSHAYRHLGRLILENDELRDSLNDHLILLMTNLSSELRASVSEHIVSTIMQWDNASMVRELELSVGRDLQFIRINGTLVGGLIGIILHAIILELS